MRRIVAVMLIMALAGCGRQNSSEQTENTPYGPSADEVARQAELDAKRTKACVQFALEQSVVAQGEADAQYMGRLERTGLEECPNDFVEAFVTFRTSLKNLIEKISEYQQYASSDRESEAMGSGIAVGLVEWLSGSSTGETPYADYVDGRKRLSSELRDRLEAAKQARQNLEIVAARYGVALTVPAPISSESVASSTNAM